MRSVREQYEKFPYPPVSPLALPRSSEGDALRFERVSQRPHDGIRILVAGAGTFETLVVAQAHPRAAEVVAVDLSERSISTLKKRLLLHRLSLFRAKLPRVRAVQADLHEWQSGEFDFIFASNVLHHLPDAAAMLKRLSGWLKPDGVMRIVTYPKQSRIWMRETAEFFRVIGLTAETPRLLEKCKHAIESLEKNHPIRSCFESQPEVTRKAGLVDAFFHSLERPLSPLEWQNAASQAGLKLSLEAQNETSRSAFVEELIPSCKSLSAWEKLQILDDTLELCANPVLWFTKGETPSIQLPDSSKHPGSENSLTKNLKPSEVADRIEGFHGHFVLQSRSRAELSQSLARADGILKNSGSSIDEWIEKLRAEVGPRVSVKNSPLPGLSILDHDPKNLRNIPEPWGHEEWEELEKILGGVCRVSEKQKGISPPPGPLAFQASFLQSRVGCLQNQLVIGINSRSS